MKIYIRSNHSDDVPIYEIPVEIEVVVPDGIYSVCASDDQYKEFYDEVDNLILSVYDSVISDMETVCSSHLGLEMIYYDESESENHSNGELSCSRYLDFCFKDHKDAGIVRVVFMLRVSDHRLPNKRKDGSDRTQKSKQRKADRLADYQSKGYSSNLPDKRIYPFEREIIVGPKVCRSEMQAISVLEDLVERYKDAIKQRELEEQRNPNNQ